MKRILEELVIHARDQNKIFVERADSRKLSPRDAEMRYRLRPGKGNAYVEFDADDAEVRSRYNPSIRSQEMYIEGDVDLTDRRSRGVLQYLAG